MPNAMTATDARKNFFKLIETAEKPGMPVMITLEGEPKVIMMSFEEFEGWQETLEIMSDPVLMRDIRIAVKERSTISLEELDKKEHAKRRVRSRSQAKGAKAVRRSSNKGKSKSTRRSPRPA